MNQILITGLKIDDHPVEVPAGLSELLSTTWRSEPKETKYSNEYSRKVSKKNGNFTTFLTKKEN